MNYKFTKIIIVSFLFLHSVSRLKEAKRFERYKNLGVN